MRCACGDGNEKRVFGRLWSAFHLIHQAPAGRVGRGGDEGDPGLGQGGMHLGYECLVIAEDFIGRFTRIQIVAACRT